MLTIIDEYTRECMAIEVERRLVKWFSDMEAL
jgi:hypothetical protein